MFSLYVTIKASPLDKGPEQGKPCSSELVNSPGKVSVLHTARPMKKARTSLVLFLNRTDDEKVVRSHTPIEGHGDSGTRSTKKGIHDVGGFHRLGRYARAPCHVAHYSRNGSALERNAGGHGTDLEPKGDGDQSMS